MQPLQNCIGPTIRIGWEILCLPYGEFFLKGLDINAFVGIPPLESYQT